MFCILTISISVITVGLSKSFNLQHHILLLREYIIKKVISMLLFDESSGNAYNLYNTIPFFSVHCWHLMTLAEIYPKQG